MAKDQFDLRYGEGISIYDDALERADNDLIRLGLQPPERPMDPETGELESSPTLPSDLSDYSPSELGAVLGEFTQWFSYATYQFKHIKVERNVRQVQKDFSWGAIRKKKTGTVSDKDNSTRTDSRYVEIGAEFEYADAKLELVGALVKGMEKSIDTISRTITVMEQRLGVEGVGAAAGRKTYKRASEKFGRSSRTRR